MVVMVLVVMGLVVAQEVTPLSRRVRKPVESRPRRAELLSVGTYPKLADATREVSRQLLGTAEP
jgi:hypothetical protein